MTLPYFPMYPTDFEADTSHLTLEEDGAYNRLLRLMWMTSGCSLPDDDAWVMRRMRVDSDTFERVVRVVIDEFFTRKAGRISNPRLAKEHQKTSLAHRKRVEAGSRGGKAKALKAKQKTPSNAVAKPYQPEPEPEPYRDTNVSLSKRAKPERFQDFWNSYPHRGGSKKGRADSEKRYARHIAAGVSEQEIITAAIRYASDRQVLDGYAKNPATWINQKGWEDEIEPVGRPAPSGNTGRGSAHDSLMAGFAQYANSDSGSGETSFHSQGPADYTSEQGMDCGPGGYTSQPILRVIGSN